MAVVTALGLGLPCLACGGRIVAVEYGETIHDVANGGYGYKVTWECNNGCKHYDWRDVPPPTTRAF